MPFIALAGTLRVAAVPQDFVTSSAAELSSSAPGGPDTCHRQLVGLPLLVLVRVTFPLPGLPPKVTTVVPVGGVNPAAIGVSLTTIVR